METFEAEPQLNFGHIGTDVQMLTGLTGFLMCASYCMQ